MSTFQRVKEYLLFGSHSFSQIVLTNSNIYFPHRDFVGFGPFLLPNPAVVFP